ncbi:hypothetical protein ONS96_002799 [Cadophora gregata f. sp. sojae]|nr:hypothetical protein ONS96_002799 [Cadophora gregata f. sp. sojae]
MGKPTRTFARMFLDFLAAYLQKLGSSWRPHLQQRRTVHSGQVKKDAFLPQASSIPTTTRLSPSPHHPKLEELLQSPAVAGAPEADWLVSSKTSHVAAVRNTKGHANVQKRREKVEKTACQHYQERTGFRTRTGYGPCHGSQEIFLR